MTLAYTACRKLTRTAIRKPQKLFKRKKPVLEGCPKILVIQFHDSYAGFCAYFLFALNQLRFAESRRYFPVVFFGEESYCVTNPFFEPSRGDNMWDYYFEPVAGLTYRDIQRKIDDPNDPLRKKGLVRLSESDLTYLNMQNPRSIYSYPYGFYMFKRESDPEWLSWNRKRAHKLVERYVRVKPHIQNWADQFYGEHMAAEKTLGVYIRGTMKGEVAGATGAKEIFPPEAYEAEIDQYVREHPRCRIFLVTEQREYLERFKNRYGERILHIPSTRSRFTLNASHEADGRNYEMGREVLLNSLLLSKCDLLLKCASHLSETALYFNPDLPSIDLKDRQK
jgi:hypothetical protein